MRRNSYRCASAIFTVRIFQPQFCLGEPSTSTGDRVALCARESPLATIQPCPPARLPAISHSHLPALLPLCFLPVLLSEAAVASYGPVWSCRLLSHLRPCTIPGASDRQLSPVQLRPSLLKLTAHGERACPQELKLAPAGEHTPYYLRHNLPSAHAAAPSLSLSISVYPLLSCLGR